MNPADPVQRQLDAYNVRDLQAFEAAVVCEVYGVHIRRVWFSNAE